MLSFIGRAVNKGNNSKVDGVDEADFNGLHQLGTQWRIVVEDVDDDDRWKSSLNRRSNTRDKGRTYA